jgi:hypothetical protein
VEEVAGGRRRRWSSAAPTVGEGAWMEGGERGEGTWREARRAVGVARYNKGRDSPGMWSPKSRAFCSGDAASASARG